MWAAAALLCALAATLGIATAPAATRPAATTFTHGFDVSWPQCSGAAARHMPPAGAEYVILGLTDGAGHTLNPCLGSQLAWARANGVKVGAYLVPSYPTRGELAAARHGAYGDCGRSLLCRLRNDGAAQVLDAVRTMRGSGMHAPMVWIDVEFRRYLPWSRSRARNAAVLQGAVREMHRLHERYGVYTTSYMWHAIAGSYYLNVPNWLPVGHTRPRVAQRMCRQTATGGPAWLVQYTRSLDSDLTCPVLDPVPGHHSRLWPFRRMRLHLFSQGRAVRAVQRVLGQPRTGTYGATTALAVTSWQASKGLPVTGTIGTVDWRAMGAFRMHGGHRFWLHRVVGRP